MSGTTRFKEWQTRDKIMSMAPLFLGILCFIAAFTWPLIGIMTLMFGFQFGWAVTELDHQYRGGTRKGKRS